MAAHWGRAARCMPGRRGRPRLRGRGPGMAPRRPPTPSGPRGWRPKPGDGDRGLRGGQRRPGTVPHSLWKAAGPARRRRVPVVAAPRAGPSPPAAPQRHFPCFFPQNVRTPCQTPSRAPPTWKYEAAWSLSADPQRVPSTGCVLWACQMGEAVCGGTSRTPASSPYI